MTNESIAKLAGRNCKRIRESKGMSQAALGDMVGVTAQAISKYEKNGISDVDTIYLIKQALGEELLTDYSNEEGTVGEIGKELLRLMVEEKGFILADDLTPERLYGMSQKRISEEICKLFKLGLCCREQFVDWTGLETDGIFITAKGVIVYKNYCADKIEASKLELLLNTVKTYENYAGDNGLFQDYVLNRKAEGLIRRLAYDGISKRIGSDSIIIHSPYRANYIQYLKTHFETGPDALKDCQERVPFNPGFSCYHDILYRMAVDISNKELWDYSFGGENINIITKQLYQLRRENQLDSNRVDEALEMFDEELPCIREIEEEEGWSESEVNLMISEYENMCMKASANPDMLETLEKQTELIGKQELLASPQRTLEGRYLNNWEESILEGHTNESHKCKYPIVGWFTADEIKKFINENMVPAATEEERLIDSKLTTINDLLPETLDYYRFPNEWELNGIADLIRKNVGIEKVD